MDRINTMLVYGMQNEHGIYFGETLCFREVQIDGSINVILDRGDEENENDLEARDGLIAIQMDDWCKADLLKRGSSVTKRWSSWIVVDGMEGIVVSVTWRPVSSVIAETRMTCVLCRTDGSRKCRHERAFLRESEIEYDNLEGNGGSDGSASEYGTDDEHIDGGNGVNEIVSEPMSDAQRDDIYIPEGGKHEAGIPAVPMSGKAMNKAYILYILLSGGSVTIIHDL